MTNTEHPDRHNEVTELACRLETAARHFYACKQRELELMGQLAQTQANIREADKALARLMPFSPDAQVLTVAINSSFPLVIQVVGEPELRGEDCYVLDAYTTRTAAAEVLSSDTPPPLAPVELVLGAGSK